MTSILRWPDRLMTVIAGMGAVLAMTMALFVVLSSVMRYLFGSPFAFTEELVGLIFISIIFAGLPVCTLRQTHIAVTIVPDLLPERAKMLMNRVAYALVFLFCVWYGLLTLDYLKTTVVLDARSAGSRLALWPWTAVLPASCLLSALAALIRIVVPHGGVGATDQIHMGAE